MNQQTIDGLRKLEEQVAQDKNSAPVPPPKPSYQLLRLLRSPRLLASNVSPPYKPPANLFHPLPWKNWENEQVDAKRLVELVDYLVPKQEEIDDDEIVYPFVPFSSLMEVAYHRIQRVGRNKRIYHISRGGVEKIQEAINVAIHTPNIDLIMGSLRVFHDDVHLPSHAVVCCVDVRNRKVYIIDSNERIVQVYFDKCNNAINDLKEYEFEWKLLNLNRGFETLGEIGKIVYVGYCVAFSGLTLELINIGGLDALAYFKYAKPHHIRNVILRYGELLASSFEKIAYISPYNVSQYIIDTISIYFIDPRTNTHFYAWEIRPGQKSLEKRKRQLSQQYIGLLDMYSPNSPSVMEALEFIWTRDKYVYYNPIERKYRVGRDKPEEMKKCADYLFDNQKIKQSMKQLIAKYPNATINCLNKFYKGAVVFMDRLIFDQTLEFNKKENGFGKYYDFKTREFVTRFIYVPFKIITSVDFALRSESLNIEEKINIMSDIRTKLTDLYRSVRIEFDPYIRSTLNRTIYVDVFRNIDSDFYTLMLDIRSHAIASKRFEEIKQFFAATYPTTKTK